MSIHLPPSYGSEIYNDYTKVLDKAIQDLEKHTDEFDGLVARGVSGTALVAPLATFLNKDWAIVRKTDAHSHSPNPVEGTIGDRWVFVDDFISTGATLVACAKAITKAYTKWNEYYRATWNYIGEKPRFVGAYLYSLQNMRSQDAFISVKAFPDEYSYTWMVIAEGLGYEALAAV